MNDLIAASQQCAIKDTHVCVECNVLMKLCTQIVDAKQLIVLKLDVWNKSLDGAKMVRRKANIISIQNSSIKVGVPCNRVFIFCLTKVLAFLICDRLCTNWPCLHLVVIRETLV